MKKIIPLIVLSLVLVPNLWAQNDTTNKEAAAEQTFRKVTERGSDNQLTREEANLLKALLKKFPNLGRLYDRNELVRIIKNHKERVINALRDDNQREPEFPSARKRISADRVRPERTARESIERLNRVPVAVDGANGSSGSGNDTLRPESVRAVPASPSVQSTGSSRGR